MITQSGQRDIRRTRLKVVLADLGRLVALSRTDWQGRESQLHWKDWVDAIDQYDAGSQLGCYQGTEGEFDFRTS